MVSEELCDLEQVILSFVIFSLFIRTMRIQMTRHIASQVNEKS